MDNNPTSNTNIEQPVPNANMGQSAPNANMGQSAPNANMGQSAPNQDNNSFSIKNIILTAVNALGGICFFLPWVVASGFGISRTANASEIGNDYRYMAYAALILFTISATIAATKIMGRSDLIQKICISAMSGLAAILSIILMINMLNELGHGSAGIGLILSIITGIASATVTWIPIKGE